MPKYQKESDWCYIAYRPPSGDIKTGIDKIRLSLDEVYNYTLEFIICGDFHVNYNLCHTGPFQL